MPNDLRELIERIGNLLRAEERRGCLSFGLQPIQLHALHYLSQCNRYSDTPAAVTDYLGLTKGTVSQTLNVLEKKGLIEKLADERDRRVIHLRMTQRGSDVLTATLPPKLFVSAVEKLTREQTQYMDELLTELLRNLQWANKTKSFGVCKSCRFFQSVENGFRCGLTRETLLIGDTEKICREHEAGGEPSKDFTFPAAVR